MKDWQWTNRCPHCGAKELTVTAVRLVATGRRTFPHTPLTPHGFVVDPEGRHERLKDQSTEDEKVVCENCNRKFNLDELAIENLLAPSVKGGTPCVRAFWQDLNGAVEGGPRNAMCINMSTKRICNLRLSPVEAEALYHALGEALQER